MKGFVRACGTIALSVLLVISGLLLYSTLRGRTVWYVRLNGDVTVNGDKTTGYMHRSSRIKVLLITRTDEARPETYWVSLGAGKLMLDCGNWHPLRSLPFPIGDLNTPCIFVDPEKIHDPPIDGTLVRLRNSVEFSTKSGKKIRAEWASSAMTLESSATKSTIN